jgi:DNA-directed RNA polymerase II subunit RPB2
MTIAMLVELLTGRKVTESESPMLYKTTMGQLFDHPGRDPEYDKIFQHPKYPACVDATPFRETRSQDPLHAINVVRQELARVGVDSCSDELMFCGITGKPLKALIFFGPTYYQRLKHMVIDKASARAKGGRTTLTRQPKAGRREAGGYKIGCMERDNLYGQGATKVGKDRLFEQSDNYYMWVCRECGLPAIVDRLETGGECRVCETNKVSKIKIPFGTKLVIQELMVMNIIPFIFVDSQGEVEVKMPDGTKVK